MFDGSTIVFKYSVVWQVIVRVGRQGIDLCHMTQDRILLNNRVILTFNFRGFP